MNGNKIKKFILIVLALLFINCSYKHNYYISYIRLNLTSDNSLNGEVLYDVFQLTKNKIILQRVYKKLRDEIWFKNFLSERGVNSNNTEEATSYLHNNTIIELERFSFTIYLCFKDELSFVPKELFDSIVFETLNFYNEVKKSSDSRKSTISHWQLPNIIIYSSMEEIVVRQYLIKKNGFVNSLR